MREVEVPDHHSSADQEHLVRLREVPGQIREMPGRLIRVDHVEAAVGLVFAPVLEEDGRLGAALRDAPRGPTVLAFRHREAHPPDAVPLAEVDERAAPTATDVEDPRAPLEPHEAGEKIELLLLRLVDRGRAIPEETRIHVPLSAEHRVEELHRALVVAADARLLVRGLVTAVHPLTARSRQVSTRLCAADSRTRSPCASARCPRRSPCGAHRGRASRSRSARCTRRCPASKTPPRSPASPSAPRTASRCSPLSCGRRPGRISTRKGTRVPEPPRCPSPSPRS